MGDFRLNRSFYSAKKKKADRNIHYVMNNIRCFSENLVTLRVITSGFDFVLRRGQIDRF